ncbi:LysR family transcriptional regulator [Myceligenerans xiligouense]|uniref:DNA-binding transcriptional LysR family regulator n=1 Tax=Myceligenerans xiligouense TaxID=253184 RepID=A0A3N4YN31_9MICO|nr:LysR family transcriptional regulator [Myceligenerans xiligouense]RPF21517.1 DNA-binding transcriptional LysR family regulator [Myceligenerans xiligouense]
MPADLDLTRLRVLAAVARTGSVTSAARVLGYAQPSVSHHLSRLESEAGIPLLQRAGRGVRLTEAGRLLADRAEEILARVDGAARELEALAEMRAGRARLAAFPSALATIVPAAVANLRADLPGLAVSLLEAEPPEAVDALRAGKVDVALVFEHTDVKHTRSIEDLSRFEVTDVFDEPVHLVRAVADAPADATDGVCDPPALATLADADWIAGCERCRADLLARCAQAGFAPRIAFETDDYVAIQALVASGAGVSTVPALTLRAHRDPGVVTAPLPGAIRRIMALTIGAPTPPARELIARLAAVGQRFADEDQLAAAS